MKNFKLTELIRCYREEKGQRCKVCRLQQAASRLPNGIEENIVALIDVVLDPAREALGKPVVVNSGFRCPLHNKAVGGACNSQHVKGEAADIRSEDNKKLARVIVKNGRFDQLIIYPTLTTSTSDATRFVHVSWKKNGGNRKQILKKTTTGYQKISINEI